MCDDVPVIGPLNKEAKKVYEDPGRAVSNVVQEVAKAPQQLLNTISDAGKGIESAVNRTLDWVTQDVINPVVNTVEDIGREVFTNDDLVLLMQLAGTFIPGMQWTVPLVTAASVRAKGGSYEDVAKAAAVSYVAQQAGAKIGSAVGSAAGSAATSAGASTATAKTAAAIAAGAARGGTTAVIYGKDPVQAMLLGGISAGVPAVLGNIPQFAALGDVEQRVISDITTAALTGKDVSKAATASLISGLVTASGVVTSTLKTFDSEGKMTPQQRALATDLLMTTAVTTISGGNAGQAVQAKLVQAGTNALGDMIRDAVFTTGAATVTESREKAEKAGEALQANIKSQEASVLTYNRTVQAINDRVKTRDEYKDLAEKAQAAYAAGTMSFADANAQITKYNEYSANMDKEYTTTLKPALDQAGKELADLQAKTGTLDKFYADTLDKYSADTSKFSEGLAPVIKSINESYATTLDPKFNALDYAKSAGLDSSKDDVYAHWLAKGQFEGIPTNKAAADLALTNEKVRLIEDLAKAKGISLAQITDTDAKNFFAEVDKKYGGDFVAIQKATIQDLVSGDAKSLNDLLKTSEANGYRVDVSGTAKGAWDKPVGYTPPEGMRLATVGEKDNGTGILSYTDKGAPVWIAQSTSPIKVWDPKQGDYVPVSWGKDGAVGTAPTTVVTAPRLKEDDYVAWTINASRTPNGLDEGLWDFGAAIAGLKAVAATGASGLGEQLQTYGSAYGLTTGGDMNNFAVQVGTAMQEWGKANTTEDIKKGMAAVSKGLEAAQKVDGFWNQSGATLLVAKDNPMAYLAYLGQEFAQEMLPLGAGFLTAAITSAFASPAAGVSAGAMVATVIEGIEVFGSTGKQVYDTLIKEGYSEEYARGKAIMAGTTAAATSAPTNALANAAIMAPYLRAVGAAGKAATGAGVAGAGVVANQIAEYAETYTQTLITQLATNKPLNFAEANVAATFASIISGGTTGVTMTPTALQGTFSLGKDTAGNKLTWEGLTTGKQTPAAMDGTAVVGKDTKGKDVTLAEVIYKGTNSEAGSVIRTSTPSVPQLDTFIDQYTVTESEVKAEYEKLGVTKPTQSDIDKLVGFYDSTQLESKAAANLEPARYNSIIAELDALSQGADQETLAEIEKTRAEVTAQLEATKQATQERIAQTETSLTKAIDDAKRAGLEGDAALSAGIDKVAADLGVTKNELLTQLGTTETQLRQDLATQIGGVQTQISDVDAAIRAEIAKNEAAGMARDVATAKAVDDVAVQLGVTKDELIARVAQSETALGQQITGLSQEVQTKYDTLNQGQKDIVTQLAQQGVDLNTAIDSVAQQVTQTQDILGRPGETATQSDVDAIINLLQTQGAYDPRYDFDGNKKIDQSDRVAVEQYIRMRQPDYIPDETIPTLFNPAVGSKWASTGLFSTVAGEAERTRQAQAAEAERTRQAQLAEAEKTRQMQAEQARRAQQLQLATAQKTQRMGNVNTMMGMLSQAPDLYGQQVSVKTPDPVNIRGAYDWSSIFGSPAQEKMFVTPYAGGGAVRSDVDTVNDELINLLRG